MPATHHAVAALLTPPTQSATLKTWAGKPEKKAEAQELLVKLAAANSAAQKGEWSGTHPTPGGGRILQALRFGGAGK